MTHIRVRRAQKGTLVPVTATVLAGTMWGMVQRDLLTLTSAECLELLQRARVGRFVYIDDEGPVAIPVNYALAGSDIVFRVEGGAKQAAVTQEALAFEVDHVEDDARSGWSVVARGACREVEISDVPELLRSIEGPPPQPWATGIHSVWLRFTPRSLTGRRLGEQRTAPLI